MSEGIGPKPERRGGHLSIGQVLSLLAAEHPELTVSKIRFLESKGLIAPERTPSGYRKFFPRDVETLRWVLVQQRDRYLPLKEIKRRLEEAPESTGIPSPAKASSDTSPLSGDPSDSPGSAEKAGKSDQKRASEREQPADSASLMFTSRRTASRIPVGVPAQTNKTQTNKSGEPGDSHSQHGSTASAAMASSGTAAQGEGRGANGDKASSNEAPRRLPNISERLLGNEPEGTPAAAKASHRVPLSGAAAEERSSADGEAPSRIQPPRLEGSVSLTADELAQAADVERQTISELHRLGLIIPSSHSGNEPVYNHEALLMVNTVLKFASRGIPARNLRMYRVAADREAGVYQQVVSTLIAREDRKRLQRELNEFLDLADAIRRSLLRRLLSPYLD